MHREPVTITKLSRPSIDDAIGYVVEVPSTLPDAQPGDFLFGVVSSINKSANSITIRFSVRTADTDDYFEDHSFDEPGIVWRMYYLHSHSVTKPWLYCLPHVLDSNQNRYKNAGKLWMSEFLFDSDFFDDETKALNHAALNHAKSMYTTYSDQSNVQIEATGSLVGVDRKKRRSARIIIEVNKKQKVMKLQEDSLVERERTAGITSRAGITKRAGITNMKKKHLTKKNMAKKSIAKRTVAKKTVAKTENGVDGKRYYCDCGKTYKFNACLNNHKNREKCSGIKETTKKTVAMKNIVKDNMEKRSPFVTVKMKTVKRQALAKLLAKTNRSSSSNSNCSSSSKEGSIQQLPVSIRNTVTSSSLEPSFALCHVYTLDDVKQSDNRADSAIEECLVSLARSKESTTAYLTKWKEIPEYRRITFTLPMVGFIFGTISISRREKNMLEGEVLCIYIDKNHRGMKYSPLLYQKFESRVIELAKMVNSNASVVVSFKPCLQDPVTLSFWEKMGFPPLLPKARGDNIAMIKSL